MADMFLINEAVKFRTPENNSNKIFSVEFDINHDCPGTDKQIWVGIMLLKAVIQKASMTLISCLITLLKQIQKIKIS